ncbi:MAG TPA: hypothetical protein VKB51_05770 [bacterium]|nr:hypothetical protein [bacterium]
MKRRSFLGTLLLAPAAAVAALLAACGTDNTVSTGTAGTCDGVMPTFISLHFHATCVSQAVLSAPAADNTVDMMITGQGHSHTLDVTAANVASINAGTQITLTSSLSAGHTHQVQFN